MKRKIAMLVVGMTAIAAANAAVRPEVSPRPKIVVGIVIDQLRSDYIEYLESYFGDRGFRRLMKAGKYMRDVDFKVEGLDAQSATAMLETGAYPARTGVPSAFVYDPTSRKTQLALTDNNSLGNFSNEAYSPVNLRLSTLSDEIQIDGAGFSNIYSFAADPQMAITMAGHSGTSACWINPENGNWASSTYYKALPSFLSNRNYQRPIALRLDTMVWKPSLDINEMPGLPPQKKMYAFRHNFPRSDKNVYSRFAISPMGNVEVTDVAIDCLKALGLGKSGNAIDMLNVAYSLAPYKYVADGDYRAELTDAYLRLDKQIERLLDAVDRYVGTGNALVWVSSTGYYDDAVIDDRKYRIPTGEFSMKRAKSLLNSYLSALHGNAEYIGTFKNNQLYFDHSLLEEKRLDVSDVVADARSFLSKMSGVDEAFTLYDILSPSTEREELLRLKVDPKRSGDIYVTFNPGWNVLEDLEYPVNVKPVRETPVLTPAFILSPGMMPETINTTVDAVRLAPTVASLLRIRSPNGASGKAIPFQY